MSSNISGWLIYLRSVSLSFLPTSDLRPNLVLTIINVSLKRIVNKQKSPSSKSHSTSKQKKWNKTRKSLQIPELNQEATRRWKYLQQMQRSSSYDRLEELCYKLRNTKCYVLSNERMSGGTVILCINSINKDIHLCNPDSK